MKNWQDFIYWEAKSNQTIDLKLVYVDLADDLIAGLMLSQIIYWHLPTKDGQTRLRIQDNKGQLWIAKHNHEWWDELRLTKDQARRGLKILRDKMLIETKTMRFQNLPCVHIRLNKAALLHQLNEQKKAELNKQSEPVDCGPEPIGCGSEPTSGGFKPTSGGPEPISNNRDYYRDYTETTSKEKERVPAQVSREEVLISNRVYEIPRNRRVQATAGRYRVFHLPKYQPDWFVKFLLMYPYKIDDMVDFGKKWDSAKLSAEDLEQINQDLPLRLKHNSAWASGKIHHPRTYLKEAMWLNPPDKTQSFQAKSNTGPGQNDSFARLQSARQHVANGGSVLDGSWG